MFVMNSLHVEPNYDWFLNHGFSPALIFKHFPFYKFSQQSNMLNQARLKVLKCREDHVQGLLEEARQRLGEVTKDRAKYGQMLKGLIAQGLYQMLEPKVIIRCRERDVSLVQVNSDIMSVWNYIGYIGTHWNPNQCEFLESRLPGKSQIQFHTCPVCCVWRCSTNVVHFLPRICPLCYLHMFFTCACVHLRINCYFQSLQHIHSYLCIAESKLIWIPVIHFDLGPCAHVANTTCLIRFYVFSHSVNNNKNVLKTKELLFL